MRILSVGIEGDCGGGQVVREIINDGLRERGHTVTAIDFENVNPAIPSTEAIRYLRRNREFDVLHCHGFVGSHALGSVIGAQLVGIPVVLHTHSAFLADLSIRERTLLRAVLLFETSLTDVLIFVSEFEQEQLRTYVSPLSEWYVVENRVRIPNINSGEVSLPDLPEEFIVCVGTVIRRKGQHRVVKAIRELPDMNLVLAGEVKMDIAGVVEENGVSDRVMVLGRISEETLHCLLERASVLVHPAEYESYGLVVAEALAHGTPVVCSERCGIKTEVTRDNGRIIPERTDSSGIRLAITEAQMLTPTPNQQVKDTDKMVDSIVRIYTDMIEDSRGYRCGRSA